MMPNERDEIGAPELIPPRFEDHYAEQDRIERELREELGLLCECRSGPHGGFTCEGCR